METFYHDAALQDTIIFPEALMFSVHYNVSRFDCLKFRVTNSEVQFDKHGNYQVAPSNWALHVKPH